MKTVFKVVADMGCQYQTFYIKADCVSRANDAVILNGAIKIVETVEVDRFHPFDIEA